MATVGGHLEVVKFLVENKADVNHTSLPLLTALQDQYHGHVEIARILIENGANLNVQVNQNTPIPPLHLAIINNHFELVPLLLEKGAETEVRDRFRETPLHHAINKMHEETIEILIKHKADVNAVYPGTDGIAPLLKVMENFQTSYIPKLMLCAGALVNVSHYYTEETPLHFAIKQEHADEELVRMLIERGIEIDAKDCQDRTALHFAANYCHHEISLMLLKNGSNVNLKDSELKTPLHFAIESGSCEVIENLINYGANNEYFNTNTQESPIHFAVKQNCQVVEDIIKLLIEKGVEINAQDYLCRTPLHVAIKNRNEDIALFLTKLGADVNSQDYEMKTPLHYAVENVMVSLIENLIDHGANINVPDCLHNTPLFIAHENKDKKVMQILFLRSLKKKCFKHQPVMFTSSLHLLSKIAVTKY